MRLIRFCYCQKGITVMFDDFDYKKALGGGGKLVKGVVKVVSPQAGPGIDEAGGGLGDILRAAGVELTDKDEAAEQAPTPTPAPQPVKSNARRFDEFGIAPRRAQPPIVLAAEEASEAPTEAESAPSDREITASLLASRGWSPADVEKILAGPLPATEKAQRIDGAKAARVTESDAVASGKTAVVNAAAPAQRVPGAKAKRIQK